jgi:hypothetical protein
MKWQVSSQQSEFPRVKVGETVCIQGNIAKSCELKTVLYLFIWILVHINFVYRVVKLKLQQGSVISLVVHILLNWDSMTSIILVWSNLYLIFFLPFFQDYTLSTSSQTKNFNLAKNRDWVSQKWRDKRCWKSLWSSQQHVWPNYHKWWLNSLE